MCKTILITNNTVTTHKMIFCGVCLSWHCSHLHGHSRITNNQDSPNINAENTNNQGSIHSGNKKEEWAASGANKLIIAKTIGNTQQNKCGNTVAMIPNLTALFFIFIFLGRLNGVPSRNRTCIRGLGNPRSIQLNYRDS